MDLVESGVWGDTGVGKEAVDEGSEIAGAWGMNKSVGVAAAAVLVAIFAAVFQNGMGGSTRLGGANMC